MMVPGKDAFSQNPGASIARIMKTGLIPKSRKSLSLILSCIDLTSLNADDTGSKVRLMCKRINELPSRFPGCPNVGAICVYPSFISEVAAHLKADGVGIASVGAGFPSSQTFFEIKLSECVQAVKVGATEIDIVLSVGKFLEGDYKYTASEIRQIKKAVGKINLKVILETGLLPTPSDIYKASQLSIQSGADFIKTSTGKVEPAASPEAVLIMCEAIRNHHRVTGRKIGIKPAGGISTPEQALQYLSIVMAVLGDEWLNPGLFRIGASRLANRILEDLQYMISGKKKFLQYF